MKAPSFEAASSCSGRRLVTSVTIVVLSSGQSLRRAVVCITAVRKDCGLKSPGNHTLFGVVRSAVHLRYELDRSDLPALGLFCQVTAMVPHFWQAPSVGNWKEYVDRALGTGVNN